MVAIFCLLASLVLYLHVLFLQYFATLSVTNPSSHKKLEAQLHWLPCIAIFRFPDGDPPISANQRFKEIIIHKMHLL